MRFLILFLLLHIGIAFHNFIGKYRKSYLTASSIETADIDVDRIINITPNAMNNLQSLLTKDPSKPCLRMGVKAGGCSGMSYVMDFITENDITNDDHEELYDGIRCVVDPKSLLFLYGLELDYSDELIGGGFKFSNPNAEGSCGCGSSFSV